MFAIDLVFCFNQAYRDDNFVMIDDRALIAKGYLKSWFIIDLLSILPFDIITDAMVTVDEQGTTSDLNSFVRVTKVSKLYKLVKITRLIRMFKLMKQKKKLEKKVKKVMVGGAQYERLSFFILVLLLLCHFVGCLWIFIAKSFSDDEVENDSWIEAGDFEEQ